MHRGKLDFLLDPRSYPHEPGSVELVETHFAWVFLAGRYVYKLKKPIRFRELDLTTLAARRTNCELEIALNRRLAPAVYIGVVRLGRRDGRWALEADTEAEDWLVKMHRLPREQMLDRVALRGPIPDGRLAPLIDELARFYARTSRAQWTPSAYVEHLAREIGNYAAELRAPDLGLDAELIARLASEQLDFLSTHAALLAARIEAGRVVDAHGDLKPEHICLGGEPAIIDCLEFSAELRQLDTAEELSFLALECARIGRPEVGERILDLTLERCGDDAPRSLVSFYRSRRALIRAWLTILHVHDPLPDGGPAYWRSRSLWYVEAAAAALRSLKAAQGTHA